MSNKSEMSCDCIESVIRRYSQTVYRLAFARVGNKYDAEEVFQEVFLRYVRKNPKFNDEEHRKAWLIKVTVNCSKTLMSSMWYSKTQELDETLAIEDDTSVNLYYELQKLPVKYREVIHLFYYEDMTVEQISKALGRKHSTVRTQLTRARVMLKDFMKGEEYV
ncbi:MAG: sigma-70 family RNA polymerase sigma factor [Ruminococcus sp.]|nr:sigma-70 family RNA polymerase sigma factor [Ruminococcus sp.]